MTLDTVEIIHLTDSHVCDDKELKRADVWWYRYVWYSVDIHW